MGRQRRDANVLPWHRTNLVIILGMMQVAKRIPFDDPNVLNICRGLYIASNLIILGIYLFTKITIDKKKGMPTAFHCLPLHSTASSSSRPRSQS